MSRTTKQLGFKCGMTGKRRFNSQSHAINRACVIIRQPTSPRQWRAYHCDFCNGWHLTKT
jgi:hypothetical protein